MPDDDIEAIARAFQIPGRFRGAERSSQGHIHATWVSTFELEGARRRYLHQRLNERVFADPLGLMANLERVLDHLRASGDPGATRRSLEWVASRAGSSSYRAPDGSLWRSFVYLEGTRSLTQVPSVDQASEAARAFAEFVRDLSDLAPESLCETIPHFHDLATRLAELERAVRADPLARVAEAGAEIDAVRAHAPLVREMAELGLPVRVTHNDTKLDNVLFDRAGRRAVCVIDLDTVMAGSVLFDFGDLVRTAACAVAEDSREPERATLRLDLFEALARGYLAGASDLLTPAEVEHFELGCRLMPLLIGSRFLTDHLLGDRYFQIQRPGQNLDRARVQLGLLASIEGSRRPIEEALRRAGRVVG